MVIEESRSLKVARKVLKAVKLKLSKVKKPSNIVFCSSGCYQNGREQGYSIQAYHKGKGSYWVMFSEFRRSDDIVVYFGSPETESMPMQSISEKAYNNAKFFKYNNVSDAADWCIEKLGLKG
jgi:hypothetical protein